jgi:proton-translocating NAD(P)+ transhydrogenase subunit beta
MTLYQFLYLAAAFFFIFALKWMSHPKTARRGVFSGEFGMLLAVVGTLIRHEVIDYQWIVIGLVVGAAIGIPIAVLMPMTAVPQRTAISLSCGAFASALIGTAEYYKAGAHPAFTNAALMVEILLGFLTTTASLMAFGKLQEILPGRPIVFKFQNYFNLGVLAVAAAIGVYNVMNPGDTHLFPIYIALALAFGVLLIIRIGGADMPTVIALLNSYSGLSSCAMGFALDNKLLIIAGALDGSSGLILSIIMCRAMNRSFSNVLFGGFGQLQASAAGQEARPVRSASPEEAAVILGDARSVVIIPGYGMAVAQAQHKIRELHDLLTKRGVDVRFAIHPVAGRMPGHMNVLLAEADVPYDKLIEMEDINSDMGMTDVALIVGANDIVNPAAQNDPGSPIAGMPILDAYKSRTVMIIKRGMSAGFAGIDNELYYMDKTLMLFGDAKSFVASLVKEIGANHE